MSDPVQFPIHLPFYPIDGTLSGQIDDNDTVFQPDVGEDLVRSRVSSSYKSISFDCRYTRKQFEDFEDWFLNTSKKRVFAFTARNVYRPNLSCTYSWINPPSDRAMVPNGSLVRVTFNLKMWL